MSRTNAALCFGLCLVTGLAHARRASAEPKSLPAIGRAVGQVTNFDPVAGTQTAIAMGRGSVMGPHINSITTFVDFETGQASGSFETVALHDSTSVMGTYTGYFQPIDGTPLIQFFLTLTIEDGSGRLEGASGEVHVAAIQSLETGEIVYRYRGTFEFVD